MVRVAKSSRGIVTLPELVMIPSKIQFSGELKAGMLVLMFEISSRNAVSTPQIIYLVRTRTNGLSTSINEYALLTVFRRLSTFNTTDEACIVGSMNAIVVL